MYKAIFSSGPHGVALLYKETMTLTSTTTYSQHGIELIAASLSTNTSTQFQILTVYKSPKASTSTLITMLHEAHKQFDPTQPSICCNF